MCNHLNIVIPCYNEEKSLEKIHQEVLKEIKTIQTSINKDLTYSIIFVNDGSKDRTLEVAGRLKRSDPNVKILDFSRNFGKEAAILAGFQESKNILESLGEGDGATILIDADCQDPVHFIHKMYDDYYTRNFEIIRVRRTNRTGEGLFRSFCSNLFYGLSNFLGGVKIRSGARDFALFSSEALEAVLRLEEYHRFSKAIFEWIGFKTKWLEYEYIPRVEGQSGWSFWKLFKYAIEGFVSFSTAPLRLAFILGFFASFISLGYGTYILMDTLIYGNSVKGYPSLVCIITFFGGLQLIVLGDYWRVYCKDL